MTRKPTFVIQESKEEEAVEDMEQLFKHEGVGGVFIPGETLIPFDCVDLVSSQLAADVSRVFYCDRDQLFGLVTLEPQLYPLTEGFVHFLLDSGL
jgi:hypothetical protein